MPSIYADYIKEKTGDLVLENEKGFAVYRYEMDKNAVYITDIYVQPGLRKTGAASELADTIVREAKGKGCTMLIGSVVPRLSDSTISLKVLLGYGMKLFESNSQIIMFTKEI